MSLFMFNKFSLDGFPYHLMPFWICPFSEITFTYPFFPGSPPWRTPNLLSCQGWHVALGVPPWIKVDNTQRVAYHFHQQTLGCSPRNVATGANPRSGKKRSSWKVAAIGESCTKPEPKSLAYRIRLLLQERVPPNVFLFGGPKPFLDSVKAS